MKISSAWLLVLSLSLFLPFPLSAADFTPLNQALKQALPTDQAFQTSLKVDADQAKQLGGGYRAGETFTIYYTKNAAGQVTARAVELKELLVKYGVLHRWVIGIRADGTISAVAVTRLGDAHAFPVADKKFQAQFAGKDASTLALGTTVDAMTGATESSQLLLDSIARARKLFDWADAR